MLDTQGDRASDLPTTRSHVDLPMGQVKRHFSSTISDIIDCPTSLCYPSACLADVRLEKERLPDAHRHAGQRRCESVHDSCARAPNSFVPCRPRDAAAKGPAVAYDASASVFQVQAQCHASVGATNLESIFSCPAPIWSSFDDHQDGDHRCHSLPGEASRAARFDCGLGCHLFTGSDRS